jgi:hypothetical protein
VLADFYLHPGELGSGFSMMKLYVTLGNALVTGGRASLTDLTVTPIPVTNIALKKAATAPVPSGEVIDVPDSVLTNGYTTNRESTYDHSKEDSGEVWSLNQDLLYGSRITIPITVELGSAHYVCAAQVTWLTGGQISDWSLLLSREADGGEDSWYEVLRVQNANLEGTTGYPDYLYLPVDDDPTSQEVRWFPCEADVRRLRVRMRRTENHVFMLTEIALYGYETAVQGPCQIRCRNGGRCMLASQSSCKCVSKWSWRGGDCQHDTSGYVYVDDPLPPVEVPDDNFTAINETGALGVAGPASGGTGDDANSGSGGVVALLLSLVAALAILATLFVLHRRNSRSQQQGRGVAPVASKYGTDEKSMVRPRSARVLVSEKPEEEVDEDELPAAYSAIVKIHQLQSMRHAANRSTVRPSIADA